MGIGKKNEFIIFDFSQNLFSSLFYYFFSCETLQSFASSAVLKSNNLRGEHHPVTAEQTPSVMREQALLGNGLERI